MTNAFKKREQEAVPVVSGGMALGESRSYLNSKDGTSITITRTGRDYAFDLATAYNNRLSETEVKRGFLWTVTKQRGEFKLKPETLGEQQRNYAIDLMRDGDPIYLDPEGKVQPVPYFM